MSLSNFNLLKRKIWGKVGLNYLYICMFENNVKILFLYTLMASFLFFFIIAVYVCVWACADYVNKKE